MDKKVDFFEVISFEKPISRILFAKLREDLPIKDLTNLLEEMRHFGITCNITKRDKITDGKKKVEIYLICGAESFAVPLEKHDENI